MTVYNGHICSYSRSFSMVCFTSHKAEVMTVWILTLSAELSGRMISSPVTSVARKEIHIIIFMRYCKLCVTLMTSYCIQILEFHKIRLTFCRIYVDVNLWSKLKISNFRGADKSLAWPTSWCILFDGENISFDASLVIYINSTNIPTIIIINRIYETQNLLSL